MRSFWTFLTVAAFLLIKFVTNFLIGNWIQDFSIFVTRLLNHPELPHFNERFAKGEAMIELRLISYNPNTIRNRVCRVFGSDFIVEIYEYIFGSKEKYILGVMLVGVDIGLSVCIGNIRGSKYCFFGDRLDLFL